MRILNVEFYFKNVSTIQIESNHTDMYVYMHYYISCGTPPPKSVHQTITLYVVTKNIHNDEN